MDFSTVFEL